MTEVARRLCIGGSGAIATGATAIAGVMDDGTAIMAITAIRITGQASIFISDSAKNIIGITAITAVIIKR